MHQAQVLLQLSVPLPSLMTYVLLLFLLCSARWVMPSAVQAAPIVASLPLRPESPFSCPQTS